MQMKRRRDDYLRLGSARNHRSVLGTACVPVSLRSPVVYLSVLQPRILVMFPEGTTAIPFPFHASIPTGLKASACSFYYRETSPPRTRSKSLLFNAQKVL